MLSAVMATGSGLALLPAQIQEPATGQGDVVEAASMSDIGDTLFIGIRADAGGFLGVVQNSATSQMIGSLMQPGLIDSDFQDGRLIYLPYLAERWEFSNGDKTLTFYLKRGVTWPDGKPITAHDVVFTYELVKDSNVASPRRTYMDNMLDKNPVTVVDAHTVQFHFKWSYNKTTMIAHASSVEVHPKHVLKDADRAALRRHKYHKQEVFGHGPYKLLQWKPGQQIVLTRNPATRLGHVPYLKNLIYKIVPDYLTSLQALKNRQIDLMESIQEKDIKEVKSWPHVRVYEKGFRFMDYIAWNIKNPLFADREVRRALTMAIDINRMIKTLLTFDGVSYAEQAYSTITPELVDYRTQGRKFLPFDAKRAKAILAEAGWKDTDGDGVLDKNGKKFEFILSTNTGNPRRADAVVFVQDDLKKIGIIANITKIEPNKFFDDLRKKDFEAALAGWSAGLFVDPSNIWGSVTKEDKKPFNHCSYSNPQVDALIEKGLHTSDMKIEAECWKEMQKLIYEDQPYTFLFWRKESFACHKRVRGIKPNILSTYFGLDTWWVPKSEHKYK